MTESGIAVQWYFLHSEDAVTPVHKEEYEFWEEGKAPRPDLEPGSLSHISWLARYLSHSAGYRHTG